MTRIQRSNPLLVLGGLAGSAAAGLAVARGGGMAALILLGLCGLAAFLVFGELGWGTVLAWVVLSVLAYPFLRYPGNQPVVTFDRIVIGGMLSWLILRPRARPAARATRYLTWALVALTAAYGLRALFTTGTAGVILDGDPRRGALNTWIDAILLPVGLFLVVSRMATTPQRCRQLAGALAIAGLTLAVIGIASRVAGFELASLSGGEARFDENVDLVRISGPYSVPEAYALTLLICLAATLWWTQMRGRASYAVGWLAVGIELTAIGLTLFRAAWIGAVIILVAALTLRRGQGLRAVAVTAGLGLVLTVGLTQLQHNAVFTERVHNTQNVDGRFATWKGGIELFREAPLVGVGVNQFRWAQANIPTPRVNGVPSAEFPHSTYIGTLAEIGLLGFLPLLAVSLATWLALRALRRGARDRDDVLLAACLVGATLAYLVMSLTLTILPYGPPNAFFLVLLGAGCARLDAIAHAPEES